MAEVENNAPDAGAASSAPDVDAGNYEVLRRRLLDRAETLQGRTEALNAERTEVFGGSKLEVAGQTRVYTDHNCVPRDMLAFGEHMLFAWNVLVGLKQEVEPTDVFGAQRIERTDGGLGVHGATLSDLGAGFLDDAGFLKDFTDLYRYYRGTRLQQVRRTDTHVLAIFQFGQSTRDRRVFRWVIQPDGTLRYIDNRGDEDDKRPAQFAFTWTATTRDDHVDGAHPHVSIRDQVFVETVGGDLTIKVEDNTEDGRGIYREPVAEPLQTLDDARIEYALIGGLIAIRVRPYNEEAWRHFLFNPRTQGVWRVDALRFACVELPEQHGVVFPGGYCLATGEFTRWHEPERPKLFERVVRAPNGEDVLYVFYEPELGAYHLIAYNLIRKEAPAPIRCHGYTLFDDGSLLVFRSTSDEPTKVHPVQVWTTPFMSAEHAAAAPTDDSYLAKLGNSELVRGISDLLSVVRFARADEPTRQTWDDLIALARKTSDAYYWLDADEVGGLAGALGEVLESAEQIVDEFEKVQALRTQADAALDEARKRQADLLGGLRLDEMNSVEAFMQALTGLRTQRGHVITLRDTRYIDLAALDALEQECIEQFDATSAAAVDFLLGDAAFEPLKQSIERLLTDIENASGTVQLEPLRETMDEVSSGLEVLGEIVAGLQVDDPTARTRILEEISGVYGQLNRVRATYDNAAKRIGAAEGRAEFAAQFTLFTQSVSSALNVADTPEACDEQMSRLLLQLEEIEARFGEFDEFVAELAAKREEVLEGFESRKQALMEERQRKARNLMNAAERILEGVKRRTRTFKTADELNTFFASDTMVMKLRGLAEQLTGLGDGTRADELASRLKSARQDALRGLRDRIELFEDGDNLIKLGTHRFTVNTQELDLTIVPGDDGMALHLTGTDFYETVDDAAFLATRDFWSQHLVSETPDVYRAEYLAFSLLDGALRGGDDPSIEALLAARVDEDQLTAMCRAVAAKRFDEGYERGVHDADAAKILGALLQLRESAGLLRFPSAPRALALLYAGSFVPGDDRDDLVRRAVSHGRMRAAFGHDEPARTFVDELETRLDAFAADAGIPVVGADGPRTLSDVIAPVDARDAARFLAHTLAAEPTRFTGSQRAADLVKAVRERVGRDDAWRAFEDDLERTGDAARRLRLALAWVNGWLDVAVAEARERFGPVALEAAALVLTERTVDRDVSSARTEAEVTGLLGQHGRITDGSMRVQLDAFLDRLGRFTRDRVPGYRAYRAARADLIERERRRLRIDEFKPRIMSAFVRNKLIDTVYLPLIGDNLAKQMGAAGANRRTDQMGMLMLISPPGYGKTTLMEYVASRLGLVFMKINGPALGHSVTSLDPSEAPSATARQEVEKLNLALEMGNNVMLYVDDIQHTHPEFLQKFISLCDAQRRIEGVWKNRTRTYDMRGKKFCVIMAGNPYTESGERFQIPDMLSNRADTYNLGDVLSGREDAFALSYIENTLTSNPVLAPLATREMADVYRIVRMAQGEEVNTTELSHGYSAVELDEIVRVLQRLFTVRDVVLKVNAQYIESASQADEYRTEPPFQLQGSYRNMNKMAEKVVAAMNDAELRAMIDDHYVGEAQTLTTGAEQNLLKLAELRGSMTDAQRERWIDIKGEYTRRKRMGGGDDDPVSRVTGTLSGLAQELEGIRRAIGGALEASSKSSDASWLQPLMARLDTLALRMSKPNDTSGAALTQAMEKLESSLLTALKAMDGRDEPLAPALEKLEQSLSSALARTHAAGSEQTREVLRELTDALSKGGFGGATTVKTQAVAGPPPVPDAARAPSAVDDATTAQLASALDRLAAALASRPALPPQTALPAPASPASATSAPAPRRGEGVHPAITADPRAASAANAPAVAAPDPRFDAVLERLDRTLRVLAMQASARRGGEEGGAAHHSDIEGFEQALGKQAALFERTLLPLVQASARNIDNATAVNARLVELLDALKLFLKHGARQD